MTATLVPNVGLLRTERDVEGLPRHALESPAMSMDSHLPAPALPYSIDGHRGGGGSTATATGNHVRLASYTCGAWRIMAPRINQLSTHALKRETLSWQHVPSARLSTSRHFQKMDILNQLQPVSCVRGSQQKPLMWCVAGKTARHTFKSTLLYYTSLYYTLLYYSIQYQYHTML